MKLFVLWLAVFFTAWLAYVTLSGKWTSLADHWPIATAMAAGAYFAGSTPLGGGTVGFPILVLLFNEPAAIGRDFSLAIQSIGMVSATFYILCKRQPLEGRLLLWCLVGATISTPIGAAFIAPRVNDLTVKLVFSIIWASFGLINILKLRAIVSAQGIRRTSSNFDREIGILLGLLGGIAASITGVGMNMILYAVLVLLYRADLKIAVPTSVIAMAYTSVVGFFSHLALGHVEPAMYGHWLAAAPVVAIAAPVGAVMVQIIPRNPTIVVISVLCVGQFAWVCINQRLIGLPLLWPILGVTAFLAVLFALARAGNRFTDRSPTPRAAPPDQRCL